MKILTVTQLNFLYTYNTTYAHLFKLLFVHLMDCEIHKGKAMTVLVTIAYSILDT